jgi:hypothetical protein
MRAARVAADDQRLAVFQAADNLGSMTAALGAELRRLRRLRRFGLWRLTVMDHNVIYSRNVVAKTDQPTDFPLTGG